MRNIVFSKERFTDESQLKSENNIIDNATEVVEAGSLMHRLLPEVIITAAFITVALFIGHFIIKLNGKAAPETNIKFAVEAIGVFAMCFLLLPYIHEFIHATLYPAKADKTVWKRQGSYLVYCEAEVSRRRMVLILAMPLIVLGLLPFVVWMAVLPVLSAEMAYILLVADIYMIFICISDIGAIWVTLRFVPNDAKVFSYGLKYYYKQ